MKNANLETKLDNAENYINQIEDLANKLNAKVELASELGTVEQLKKLANNAKNEVKNAKNDNK